MYDLCMHAAMFCRVVWPIILVVIHSRGNKELNISDFGGFLSGIPFAQMANNLQI